MPSALVIVNPVSPHLPPHRELGDALFWLRQQGYRADQVLTRHAGDATTLAAGAAQEGRSLVVVCGGDGTISEAANGLAGSDTALSVIPAGTANVWAKEVGIPRRPLAALEVAVHGQARRMDLGLARGSAEKERRYFFLMAGLGLDGQIAAALPLGVKRHLGATTYALAAIRESLRYRGQPVTLLFDGEPVRTRLLMMIVGNTRNYAGVTQITRRAYADDGLLDVCVFSGLDTLDIILQTLRVIAGAHLGSTAVLHRRVRQLELQSDTPLPTQLDGDFYPAYPTAFEVTPAALRVMVPRRRLPLFRRPPLSR
jgi:diacylglycerol kinase (ATP)